MFSFSFSSIRLLTRTCSVTHMAPGETSTPILRSTITNAAPAQPGAVAQAPQPRDAANGQEDYLHQVNLSSPPPPAAQAVSMQKAEFY